MDLGLANATTVVVGGSRGMGRATADCLADEGAKVAIIARNQADIDTAIEESSRRGSPDAIDVDGPIALPSRGNCQA